MVIADVNHLREHLREILFMLKENLGTSPKSLRFWVLMPVLLLVFVEFFHPILALTQDLGRHLKIGEIILQTKSVSSVNLFSYTFPNFKFINTHWLSEVIFYIIFRFSGFSGLLIFTTSVVVVSFLIVSAFIIKKINVFAFCLSTILYLGILFERTDIRPEIFSFLFLSLFVTLLYKYKQEFTKLIFLLPLIELLWVNMHIYFIIGILIAWLFLFDELVVQRKIISLFLRGKEKIPERLIILAGVVTLTTLSTFINPNGLSRVFYPFHVFDNYAYSIKENQNIFTLQGLFLSPTIIFFEVAGIALFILLLINFKKTRLIDWLLFICFSIIAASAVRNLPLFVFATFIPFARNLSDTPNSIKSLQKKSYLGIRFVAVFSLFIFEAYIFIATSGFGWTVPRGAESGADFFIANKLKGPIYNNFDIGSYLIYRLYPNEKVFVDGRPEAYPANFDRDIDKRLQNDSAFFNTIVNRYHINAIIFTHTEQTPSADIFVKNILQDQDWKLVYLDDYVFIMIKNDSGNKYIISKSAIREDNYQIDNNVLKDKIALKLLANFFDNAGWRNQEITVLRSMLVIDPYNCQALNNLLSLTKNADIDQIYLWKSHGNCKLRSTIGH